MKNEQKYDKYQGLVHGREKQGVVKNQDTSNKRDIPDEIKEWKQLIYRYRLCFVAGNALLYYKRCGLGRLNCVRLIFHSALSGKNNDTALPLFAKWYTTIVL